jgi:hypothetical protein
VTAWQEFPLRAQGRPWPGINTRSGTLDDGTGQMTDASVNVIINRADRLSKRKGLIRGLDERFAGAVCGLHRYTDECGIEWLLVADEEGISIRQPFSIPSFPNSDAYPSDDFQSAGAVDPNFWNNTDAYIQAGGSLRLAGSLLNGGDMSWFKDAANFSYQIEVEFDLDPDSRVVGVIKQSSGSSRIEGRIIALDFLDPNELQVDLVWISSLGVVSVLGSELINIPSGVRSGTFTLSYSREIGSSSSVFRVKLVVQPTDVGAVTIEDFGTLNVIDDADLGQGTSLRIERDSAASVPKILSVQGEPI